MQIPYLRHTLNTRRYDNMTREEFKKRLTRKDNTYERS